jgi:class 3 adenylate cyclase/Tfp pilus assembly protein PilF
MDGESEILVLKETIADDNTTDIEKVDAMNRLAMLYFDNNLAEAYEISRRSAAHAMASTYLAGQAQALQHAGMAAAAQRNYIEANDLYLQALKIRQQQGDSESQAAVYAKLGNTNLYEGKYPEALEYYANAIELRTQLNDELGVADLNVNSAIIHGFLGNYTLALKSHLQALVVYEKQNLQTRIASTTSNIGLVYNEQQNYDEALKMFERALAIRRQANDTKSVADLLNNIGIVYNEQQRYEDAMQIHGEALELRLQMGDKAKIASSYSNLGNIYRATGNVQMALEYYQKSLALFTQVNEKRGLVQSYNNLGELYFDLRNHTEARHYITQAIKLGEETGLKNQVRKSYEFLSALYANEGKYKEAYDSHVTYMRLDQEILNSETSKQMAQMTLRYEIEQKEQIAETERIKNIELTKAFNQLEEEKKRSEQLLNNILPEEISEELKTYGKTKARSFESVTVLFADIQGFTKISEQLSAEEIVSGIDEYFEMFDVIVDKHNIEKIKTIGDAYLCAGGIPIATNDHAERTIAAAIDFLEAIESLSSKRQAKGQRAFTFRVGVHSGPLVAGVVGIKKFAYDIWGDTVNTASRLQQNSEANRINISESTRLLIKDKFNCVYRGEIESKNKGKLKMYFVDKK